MPIGGENVGTAYVRIIADGSEIPDGIREGLEDSEPLMEQQGNRNAKRYQESFNSNVVKNSRANRDALAQSLQIGAGRMDAIAKSNADGVFDSLRTALRTRVGGADNTIADTIYDNLLGDYRKSGNFKALQNSLETLPALVDKAVSDIQKIEQSAARDRQKAMLDEAYTLNREFDKRLTFAQNKAKEERASMLAEAYALNREFDKKAKFSRDSFERETRELFARTAEMSNNTRKIISENSRALADLAREEREEIALAYRLNDQFDRRRKRSLQEVGDAYKVLLGQVTDLEKGVKGVDASSGDLYREIDRLRGRLTGVGGDETLSAELERVTRRVDDLRPRTARMNAVFDDTERILGKISGKGSRNNFLNFIGSSVQGIARLVTSVPRFVASVGGDMASAFTKAGGGASGLLGAGKALIPALATLAGGAVAVAGGLVVLTAILGPLASLLSGLLGIVAALASTISFGLVAALGGIVAVAAPVVAAIATITFGLKNLSENDIAQVSRATRGLRQDFSDLGRDVGRILVQDIGEQSKNLQTTLGFIRPVVEGIADSISKVATSWTEALSGPGFERFSNSLSDFLPGAVEKLGSIIENTVGGFGGVFEAMIPFMERVLDYLDDLTGDFSKWANSAKGQNEIKDFFDRAGDSAEKLGDFLGSVRDLLFEVLDAGKGTGDNIFDSMADSISGFVDNLEENPDTLKQWYEDAEDLANSIGDALVALKDFVAELDTEENREAVRDIVDGFKEAVKVVTELTNLTGGIKDAVTGNGAGLMQRILGTDKNPTQLGAKYGTDFRGGLETAISAGGNLLGRLFKGAGATARATGRGIINGIAKGISSVTVRIMDSIDLPSVSQLTRPFRGLAGRILSVIGNIRLLGNFDFPSVSQMVRFVVGLAGRILSTIGRINMLRNFDFPSVFQLTGFVVGLASRILSTMGIVRLLEAFEFPSLSTIAGRFAGLGGQILGAIGRVVIDVGVNLPNIPGVDIPGLASGGLLSRATLMVGGEDGPEAVVPLNRPLSQVDPAVRALSAFAQGIPFGGVSNDHSTSRSVDVGGITIVTPTEDPAAVATETVNRLVAAATML